MAEKADNDNLTTDEEIALSQIKEEQILGLWAMLDRSPEVGEKILDYAKLKLGIVKPKKNVTDREQAQMWDLLVKAVDAYSDETDALPSALDDNFLQHVCKCMDREMLVGRGGPKM